MDFDIIDVVFAADNVNILRVLIASRDMREVSDWAIVSESYYMGCFFVMKSRYYDHVLMEIVIFSSAARARGEVRQQTTAPFFCKIFFLHRRLMPALSCMHHMVPAYHESLAAAQIRIGSKASSWTTILGLT